MTDSKGLITRKRPDGDHLPKHKQEMARADDPPLKSLKEVIAHAKPHALIGLSGAGPSWTKARACSSGFPFCALPSCMRCLCLPAASC
jgi:malic enzyme